MKLVGVMVAAALATACSSSSLLPSDGGAGRTGGDGGGATGSDDAAAGGANAGTTGLGGAAGTPTGGAAGEPSSVQEIDWSGTKDLDLLFMIDNSFSMQPLQNKLTASFPEFMSVLKGLPLPNVHIAVVSSDLGAGKFGIPDVPCVHGGDQGKFQFAAKGTTCAAGSLYPGQTFISNIAGNANYKGDISDVFSCIAALGQNGCGFEHQFGSVLRALGADGHGAAPPENAGFLRPAAWLAVVLLTNEDDCSAPIDSGVFDPASKYITDPLGPLTSYRCNLVGHRCGGAPPPRTAAGPLDGCVSAEDGVLLKVADVAAQLKSLKADPSRVLVAAIAGPEKPYVVRGDQQPTNDDPAKLWPYVDHSCMQADNTFADPSVRISQWLRAFGDNGTFDSICNDSLKPALERIAQKISSKLSSFQCLGAKPFDTNAVAPGLQAGCSFVDHAYTADGTRIDTPLPSCASNGGVVPCWALVTDARCASTPLIDVRRPPGAPPPTSTTVTCLTCPAGDTRAGCQK
jgi:hypothetical protein